MKYLGDSDQSYVEQGAVQEVTGAGRAGTVRMPISVVQAVQQVRSVAARTPSGQSIFLPLKVNVEVARQNLHNLQKVWQNTYNDAPEMKTVESQMAAAQQSYNRAYDLERDTRNKIEQDYRDNIIKQAKNIRSRIDRMVSAGWEYDSAGRASINKAKAAYQELVKDIPTQEGFVQQMDIRGIFFRKLLDRIATFVNVIGVRVD